jgi:hypothetical protein
MKTMLKSSPQDVAANSQADEDIDRILGDCALFPLDLRPYGGPSPPTLYRARRAGMIETVTSGNRTRLTRATAKRILLEGLAPVRFFYGKQHRSA